MLYNKEVKQIKDQIVKQIIGNYLKGAGENAAYLKEVKASNLGAVFLNYGEAIDLTSETLVDYNKSNPKMQSAGTLSLLIKETFDKIDRYAMKCETMEYPTAVVKKDLTKYANSLLDGVNIVAFSEGEADIDLKSDIKVLLREGREEFNKRMSEEENEIKEAQDKATQDPTATEYAPTEEEATDEVEDDSDFIEEDTDAEEETDETDEEEPEDEETDYDKLAQDEYGSEEEEEESKDESEEEEDEIPSGESFSFSEGVVSDKLKKIKSIIKSKTDTMIQKWKEMNERIKIANEKARQPKGYPERTPEEKEAIRVKEFTAFKAMLDEYVGSMEKWIYSNDRDTSWAAYMDLSKFFSETWYAPETALYYGGAYDDVQKYMDDVYVELDNKFIKHMKEKFNEVVPPLKETSGESYFSFGEGLTDITTKFKAKIKATIEQSKKDKADKTQVKKDKKIAGFAKLIDDYIAAINEFIFADDFYTCAKAYQMALDRLYSYEEDRGFKLAYIDVYEEVIGVIYDKADELHDKVAKYVKDNFDIDIDSEADIAKYAKDNFDVDIDSDFSFGEGVVSDKLKKIKSIIKSKTDTMIQKWKEMNERIKIANEKARQPKGYPERTPEEKEAIRVKEFTAFKAMLDEYVGSMEKWIYSNDRDTSWAAYMDLSKFFSETWYAPETALYYGGAYDDVQKYMDDVYVELDNKFIKHMKEKFNEVVPPLKETSGESFSSYGEGLTDITTKFKAKIKATIEQSKKDKADKKVENFMKNIDSYVETMEEFIYGTDLESCIKAYDLTMDRIYSYIDNARMKQTYGDTYPKIEEALFTKGDELNEEFSKYTRDVFGVEEMESIDIKTPGETGTGESHMFKRKYGYTTIDPQAFSEMINTLLETESDTLKAFSESKGMSYIAESEDYAITSKTLINTTAVVLAARYKFGFYN